MRRNQRGNSKGGSGDEFDNEYENEYGDIERLSKELLHEDCPEVEQATRAR